MDRKKKAKLVRVLFWFLCAVVTIILAPGLPLLVNSERLREVAPGIERSMGAVVQAISEKTFVCAPEPQVGEKTRAFDCSNNETPTPGTVTSCQVGLLSGTFERWARGLLSGRYSRGGVGLLVDSEFPPTAGVRKLEENASGFGHNFHQWLTACDDAKITPAERKDLDESRHEMETDLRAFQAALAEHELWAERIKWFITTVVFVQVGLLAWFGISRGRRAATRNRAPSPEAPTHEPW
jgi:hypothetical protein